MSAQQFGPYRVLRELARGGQGAVFEVVDETTGARYALKRILTSGVGAAGAEDLLRFRREAEILAQLDHPNLVRVHAAELAGETPYLVQQLLPGGSLQARLEREGPLPLDDALELVRALALGLAHAHDRGVIHRDLKPDNVLFDERGEPRIVDFGLGRQTDAASLTATGQILGTPGYMAPEQAEGRAATDARTDVYGLGGILYAALTGHPPFDGSTLHALLSAVLNDPPQTPSALRPQIPPWLDQVCLRALAKRPEDRFSDPRQLAAALRRPRAHRSARLPLAMAAGALLLGLLLAAFLLTQEDAPDRHPGAGKTEPARKTTTPLADPQEAATRAFRALLTGPLDPPPAGIDGQFVTLERKRRRVDRFLDRSAIDLERLAQQTKPGLHAGHSLLDSALVAREGPPAAVLLPAVQRTIVRLALALVDGPLLYTRGRTAEDQALRALVLRARKLAPGSVPARELDLALAWHEWKLGTDFDPKSLDPARLKELANDGRLSPRCHFLARAMFLLCPTDNRFAGRPSVKLSPTEDLRVLDEQLAPRFATFHKQYVSITTRLLLRRARHRCRLAWAALLRQEHRRARAELALARAEGKRALEHGQRMGGRFYRDRAHTILTLVSLIGGRAAQAREHAEQLSDPILEETLLAECDLLEGQPGKAFLRLRQLIDKKRLGRKKPGSWELWTCLAHASWLLGDTKGTRRVLAQAARLGPKLEAHGVPWRTYDYTRRLIRAPKTTWWPGRKGK